MKRILTLLVLFSGMAVSAAYVFAQNPTAVIKEITGTVELKRSEASQWVPARAGDTIQKNTIISTGFKSTAVLAIGNSTVLVRPITRLSLGELMNVNDTETVNMNLNGGRVRVDVNPPAGKRVSFAVQSPSSTASVRGTSFEMDPFSLRVTEGEVIYAPAAGRAVTVSAGQASRVVVGGGALTPMAAAEESSLLPALPGENPGMASARIRMRNSGLSIEIEFDIPE